MTFLKYILSFLLSIFFVSTVSLAQTAVTYEVEWFGFNASQQLTSGEIVTYPMAKDALINRNGVLVLQKDVPGKITGSVSQESISYYAGDSASKSALSKLTYETSSAITYTHLYNKGVTSRIYIPLLKKNSDGTWAQISSFTLRYTISTSIDETPVQQGNPYTTNAYSSARTTSATGSVLATGNWFKLGVSQTGIYKIDASYLSSIGINTSTLNPATIQIYGNGGGMLPQANSVSRLDDLVENAIFISEDGNGIFDNNDYILFYGESPHTWTFDATDKTYAHQLNLYADQNFYFLTYGQQSGKRIASIASIGGTGQTLSEFDEHLFDETDTYNILDSGREWYGFQFSPYTQNLTTNFNVTGLVSGSTLTLGTHVISRSYVSTNMNYTCSSSSFTADLTLPILSTADHAPLGIDARATYSFTTSATTNLAVQMYFSGGNSSSTANNNWLELRFLKSLRLYGNQTFFRASQSVTKTTTTYSIGNTDGSEQIWDLSDPQNIVSQNFTVAGTAIEFGANSSTLKEYVVLKGAAFNNPTFIERVTNQNLHDITSANMPDMIIVTHPDFMAQAQKLANYRQNNDGISSYICTPAQIYNEFGGGKADVTAIRDFVKMVYDRGTTGAELKYLLFFGSCTYDYKNHYGTGGNFVPTYESRQSLDELRSYNSDDYFGFMDPTEGYWDESPLAIDDHTLNIGVGRIPVRTAYQADIVVNKLISASKPSSQVNGNWKNKMTLIADDGDLNEHLTNAEIIYNLINNSYNKQININKIYLDAYPQESTPGGETAPQVNTAINRDVDDGTLIWNYIGHGGNTGLAQENLVNIPSINSWTNINKLGFYITATCSFGRYDKPGLTSGAETIFLSATGGSFANLTSTRTVYSHSNLSINKAFYQYAFLRNADGSFYSLGDIMLLTKNNSLEGVNNRNYSLLGDPSMRIQYPQQKMVITSVNGVAVNAVPDTLKALSKVTLEGLVQDAVSGSTLTGYNGLSKITIYDKPTTIATYGTSGSTATTFKLQSNIIFDGLATVTNGTFKVSFIVPKDISYQYDYGKISLYSELTNGTTDAGGYLSNIVIGGSNPNAPDDKTPPTVKLYLNDPSFVSGGITRENPVFFADVSDENGINVSAAGIGHEITLVLSTSTEVIILNKYYTAAQDDYSKGKVEFPLKDLPPGTYSLQFKVWDTYNNSTEQTLEFTIQSTEKLQLSHVLNYPNPFTTNTTFHFDHNRVGDNLMVQVQIFTVSGKLVKTLDETIYNSPSHVANLSWDGLDDFGDKIGRGVYVYKLKIRSLQDGSTTHVFEKLVLLN